jgi:putative transposase
MDDTPVNDAYSTGNGSGCKSKINISGCVDLIVADVRRLQLKSFKNQFEPPHVGCYKTFVDSNVNRAFYLPRLPLEYYQGDAVVHWTLPISQRQQGWLDEAFHAAFRELILHAAAREGLLCPTYCLMPDHLHLIWMGLRLDSDQRNGMAFLRTHLERRLAPLKFQHQAHDHVLKEDERRRNAFVCVSNYILENPLRAELVKNPIEWKFNGAIIPGYPTLHPLQGDFWGKFWKLYSQARQLDAGQILRPPLP